MIDVPSLNEVSRIKVGKGPQGIVLIPDVKFLWVALYDEHKVVVVDANSGEIINTIRVEKNPYYLDITPDGKQV